MEADIPQPEPMDSTYLTQRVDRAEKAERMYALLSEDGESLCKWNKLFLPPGLRDKFGTS